jgi:hypothetical protein
VLRVLHDMTQFQIVATTTLVNDGITVEVFPVARGWLVRMTDDDSGGIVGQRIYPLETDAIAYARKIIGTES